MSYSVLRGDKIMESNDYTIITKYQNDMNLVPLRNFNAVEIDLFFAICTKLKEKGITKVKYSFENLRTLSEYHSNNTRERFINDLERVYDKMHNLTYTERNENTIQKFNLFTHYKISKNEEYVEISLNPELAYILNNLTGNFTRFELQELTDIKSSYAKNMFRFLKQFRTTGYFKIEINDFKERLDVPKSYKMCDIDKRVINVIKRDLKDNFKSLKVTKLKKGNKVTHLEFTFKKEDKYEKPIKSYEKTPEWIGKEQKENANIDEEEKKKLQEQLDNMWEDE